MGIKLIDWEAAEKADHMLLNLTDEFKEMHKETFKLMINNWLDDAIASAKTHEMRN